MKYLSRTESADLSIIPSYDDSFRDHAFSNGDRIQGEVLLNAHEDLTVEAVSIAFVGRSVWTTPTLSHLARQLPRNKTVHTFLTMQQPIKSQVLPHVEFLRAGSTSRFPFTFTVPSLLISRVCKHESRSTSSSDCSQPPSHLLLPPSLGEPDPGRGYKGPAAGSARVEYMVMARLRLKLTRGGIMQGIATCVPVRIEPELGLDTLLDAPHHFYSCRHSVSWSHNRRLFLEATTLSPILSKIMLSNGPSLLRTVLMTFQFCSPMTMSFPPLLQSIKIKLRAQTDCNPLPSSQSSESLLSETDTHNYSITEVIDLARDDLPGLLWQRSGTFSMLSTSNSVGLHSKESKPPAYSWKVPAASDSSAVSQDSQDSIHEATLNIPIRLPKAPQGRGTFGLVPTFESCLVAREYSLELKLFFTCASAEWWQKSATKKVKLEVPVQVISASARQHRGTASNPDSQRDSSRSSSASSVQISTISDHARYDDLPAYRAFPGYPV